MNDFIKAALIRMIRTIAQTAVSVIGTAMVISDVNWAVVASASALAGILSLLTSLATGLPEVELADVIEDTIEDFDDEEDWYGLEDNMEVDEYEEPKEDSDEVE